MTIDPELAERDRALETLDLAFGRRMMPNASSDDVILIALHKARVEVVRIREPSRRESMHWLKRRGLSRINGLMWPKNDELPE